MSDFYTKGNLKLLNYPSTGLFCSGKCPGELILKTYDLALTWRDDFRAVTSGFHSPMEKECLNLLLKGGGGIIICPARGIWKRLPGEWKPAIIKGRLLIVSSFPPEAIRASAVQSVQRNVLVGKLSKDIFVAYARPGGKLELLCQEWIRQGKQILTFKSDYTQNLLTMGATILDC